MLKRLLSLLILLLSACTTVGPAHEGFTPTLPALVLPSATPEPTVTTTPTPLPTATSTPGATITPAPATYYHFEPGINPLTGLPVAEPVNLNRRPVMVKVSNWPREGRPHAGLSSADLVFEYFIGHQMNRFLAVYYGNNAEVIGPVRSGRLVDAQLANLYQGLLAYGNADPQVDNVLVEQLEARALSFNELPCPAMCGQSTHSATGVYANSGALSDYALNLGIDNSMPDLRGMLFQPEPPPVDGSGSLLRVEYANFSIMQWHYDPQSHTYHLWEEAELAQGLDLAPMIDRNNDQPIAFENLIVMYAEYIEYKPSLHEILIQDVADYQPALLFRDGGVTFGTWRVPEPDRPIVFELPEGGALPLKPGKTWIVIVGTGSQTVQPIGGEWEVYFDL